jgi:hypothetical protein
MSILVFKKIIMQLNSNRLQFLFHILFHFYVLINLIYDHIEKLWFNFVVKFIFTWVIDEKSINCQLFQVLRCIMSSKPLQNRQASLVIISQPVFVNKKRFWTLIWYLELFDLIGVSYDEFRDLFFQTSSFYYLAKC